MFLVGKENIFRSLLHFKSKFKKNSIQGAQRLMVLTHVDNKPELNVSNGSEHGNLKATMGSAIKFVNKAKFPNFLTKTCTLAKFCSLDESSEVGTT